MLLQLSWFVEIQSARAVKSTHQYIRHCNRLIWLSFVAKSIPCSPMRFELGPNKVAWRPVRDTAACTFISPSRDTRVNGELDKTLDQLCNESQICCKISHRALTSLVWRLNVNKSWLLSWTPLRTNSPRPPPGSFSADSAQMPVRIH